MSQPIGLGVDVSVGYMKISRDSARRPTVPPSQIFEADMLVSPLNTSGDGTSVPSDANDTRRAATDDHVSCHPSTLSSFAAATTSSRSRAAANDSGFSRHDSLFSFGVSSSRNAAELKSLLGNSHSRLKPGATVLSTHDSVLNKRERHKHAVSLEQAKARARVEVDIVLESDCYVEGGYMRGSIKLRVRRRQKKEDPVLLAEGKVRVIGFECIPGERDRHTFYQRASPLSAITDAYTGVYDSPPDSEGFSRAMEGVHILPFAMHLPIDDACGSAKGVATIQSGVTIRYIAMISIKVKDSRTGKRSIAHFYRDCEVWPRMNPSVVLANAPRPIQASTAKSLSVIGNGHKLKLTAMLHRLTWIAGQRCFVRIWIANDTKKTIKSVSLTLVRTTTLFKPKPQLDPGNRMSIDPDACQTATSHKVVAEELLERSHSVAKGHASAQGWWTGVQPGQEAQFSHWILIPSDALSIPRSRLVEVEYSIRVTVSAGALTSDVHVTLPIRIINFLSVDPTPSEPLLSSDGAYTRLITYDHLSAQDSLCDSLADAPSAISEGGRLSDIPSLATAKYPSAIRQTHPPRDCAPTSSSKAHRIPLDTPLCKQTRRKDRRHSNPTELASSNQDEDEEPDGDLSMSSTGTSESDTSMFSAASSVDSLSSPTGPKHDLAQSSARVLGNLEVDDDADSDDEVELIVGTAQLDSGRFPESRASLANLGLALDGHDSSGEAYEGCAEDPDMHMRDTVEDDRQREAGAPDVNGSGHTNKSLARLRQSAAAQRERREQRSPLWRRTRIPGPGSLRGPRHIREPAAGRRRHDVDDLMGCGGGGGGDVYAADIVDEGEGKEEDGGGDDTPRLGTSLTCPSALSESRPLSCSSPDPSESVVDAVPSISRPIVVSASASSRISAFTEGSSQRLSRQLPLPPPRPSQLSDIPTSVSALEAIRLSRLSRPSPSEESESTLSRSSAHRSLPTTPSRPSATATSSHPRPTYDRSETVPHSQALSAASIRLGMHQQRQQRPTDALRHTGQSDCSVVRGRIAAFEARLQHSRETGAAYA